jgi:hypothetical protein
MDILLINESPVVSRLFSLCTNDDTVHFEEVAKSDEIRQEQYDIVFIDESSYEGEMLDLENRMDSRYKVLLAYEDVGIDNFDMTIKKPFLPSQIIEILKHLKEVPMLDEDLEGKEEQVSDDLENISEIKSHEVLDRNEIDKIKELLDLADEESQDQEVIEEDYEQRKIEVIKEQLIAEGLELIDEEEIVEELTEAEDDEVLNESDYEALESLDDESLEKKKNKKKKKKKIEFTSEELAYIEDAAQVAVANLKRKQMKKLLKGKEVEITIKLKDIK